MMESSSHGSKDMGDMMMMPMYFNTNTENVYFLFQAWKPANEWQFGASCLLVAALAASVEVFRFKIASIGKRKPLARAALTFISYSLSYSLMLLAMTFNVYIFVAVVGGYALGALILHGVVDRQFMANHRSSATRGLALEDSSFVPVGNVVNVLKIGGMTCDGCRIVVETALKSVDKSGSISVLVDLSAGTATIVGPPISVPLLVEAVERTGRSATPVVVDAPLSPLDAICEGVSSNPPCCPA